jgi:hypothetical protein
LCFCPPECSASRSCTMRCVRATLVFFYGALFLCHSSIVCILSLSPTPCQLLHIPVVGLHFQRRKGSPSGVVRDARAAGTGPWRPARCLVLARSVAFTLALGHLSLYLFQTALALPTDRSRTRPTRADTVHPDALDPALHGAVGALLPLAPVPRERSAGMHHHPRNTTLSPDTRTVLTSRQAVRRSTAWAAGIALIVVLIEACVLSVCCCLRSVYDARLRSCR